MGDDTDCMNTYTPDGQSVLDAAGQPWPCNTWHPMPLPEGITQTSEDEPILFSTIGFIRCHSQRSRSSTHWLCRSPLPAPPKAKTREELDLEMFMAWVDRDAFLITRERMSPQWQYAQSAWFAALDYERSRK